MSLTPDRVPWCGWGTQTIAQPTSLEDVMSQELAEKLQKEECDYSRSSITEFELPAELEAEIDQDDTANDLLMAQLLQLEFDKENDERLRKHQKHYNKNSKISVSFEKFCTVHPAQRAEVYSDEETEAVEHKLQNPNLQFSKKGIRGAGKTIVTKHDIEICGRKNASNAMDKFDHRLNTGDTDKYDVVLPNKVYNKLRVHSMDQAKRAARLHEKKDQSTATQAVDRKTRLILFKMLNGGMLKQVNGVISVGKESAVLHALGGEIQDKHKNKIQLPAECALKVFKTTLADFRNREMYVKGDFRLANEFKKQNPRKIMKMWAEKEMLNLKRMKKFGVSCPEVIKVRKHILVMQFIGKDQVAAPKIKDANLSANTLIDAYNQVVEGMKLLYNKCDLVHADLSEYNLLWHDGRVYMIDVSQSVDLSHPLCHQFLLRDCKNVVSFFGKQEMAFKLPNERELFNEITGMSLFTTVTEQEFLQQIQEYEKEKLAHQLDAQRKEFAFDYMFTQRGKDSTNADEVSNSMQPEIDNEYSDDDDDDIEDDDINDDDVDDDDDVDVSNDEVDDKYAKGSS